METRVVRGYNIHIYYDQQDGPGAASALRDAIAERFDVEIGMRRDKPGGPHPAPMFQVNFAAVLFADVVPWLMLNRGGLDLLVHPETGDDVADHGDHALWLGQTLRIDFDAVREFIEERRRREATGAAG